MKKILLILSLVFVSIAQAFDISLLANNKESVSKQITANERYWVREWLKHHHMRPEEIKAKSQQVLKTVMLSFTKREPYCDLALPKLFSEEASNQGLLKTQAEYKTFVSYLREQNLIDDIFFRILIDTSDLSDALTNASDTRSVRRPLNLYTRESSSVDLEKFYVNYKAWPNDINECTIGQYYGLMSQLTWKNGTDRDNQIHRLNYLGYQAGVLSLEIYQKLEVLRTYKIMDWTSNVPGYLDVVTKAKDKLTKEIELQSESNFSTNYVSRRDQLTQRERLYKFFNSSQIMMLAQIIEKTTKRLDATYVAINFQYTEDPNGETETYIFSPMEQYRIAVKMLRKDIAEIARSDMFRGISLEYEDIIAAAFETGLLKSEDLNQVLKFEDFWNPKTPRWKTYTNFAFSMAGTASFVLPPPYNILASVALIFTQSFLIKKDKPKPEDNWNVII